MTQFKKNIWNDKRYYQKIEHSEKFDHPAFATIIGACQNAQTILDVGCGDGLKLEILGNSATKKYGCDVSQLAVGLAKKRIPTGNFQVAAGEKLPYSDARFDRVMCLFVLEHVENPEEVLREIIRVTQRHGQIFLLAPNFGSPNRASPNFSGSRASKLINGFLGDIVRNGQLGWAQVESTSHTMTEFQRDEDTTIEPYVRSLSDYLKKHSCEILRASSFWHLEQANPNWIQKVFRILGELKIYPFNYWGPHLFVIARKNGST